MRLGCDGADYGFEASLVELFGSGGSASYVTDEAKVGFSSRRSISETLNDDMIDNTNSANKN